MADLFASDAWLVVVAAVLWWFLSLFPVLYSALKVVGRGTALPRRTLFVATVAGLSYGFTAIFLFFISLPLSAFAIFVAPQLDAIGKLPTFGLWLTSASRAISDWGWFVIPVVLGIFSVMLTHYLLPRWTPVVSALGPNNSFKPNLLRKSA